jgi:addiction module HigA family antidote
MKQSKLPPVHPGEVLLEEFLKPLAISQYRLAKDISVPPRRVNEIVLRKRSISADTALRLSRFFGTSAEFWLNLQSQYDLDVETDRLGGRLEAEVIKFTRRPPSSMARPAVKSSHSVKRSASAMRRAK